MTGEKLRVERLSKAFSLHGEDNGRRGDAGNVQALHEVSFGVNPGELVAVIGRSGCGKSTLLRIIQCLIPQDSGQVYINDRVVTRPGHDRGMVFQHAGLLPWRTAQKNVEFGLEAKRVQADQRRETARRYLHLVGLAGFEQHFAHQLSGGMQQRVGLARALAIEPDILLMDEPFGALDAQTRLQLQEELLRIHQETRKTILFVTHDLDEAVYLADRVIVMSSRPGRIQQIIDVELPRPRPRAVEVVQSPAFATKRALVWELLQQGTAGVQ